MLSNNVVLWSLESVWLLYPLVYLKTYIKTYKTNVMWDYQFKFSPQRAEKRGNEMSAVSFFFVRRISSPKLENT